VLNGGQKCRGGLGGDLDDALCQSELTLATIARFGE
jgi:hypothetical protein